MTKLFIHIGPHKTGSTAIQSAIFSNRTYLRDNGIYVPEAGMTRAKDAHHNLAWQISNDQPYRADLLGWEELIEEVEGKDVALISSEALCSYPNAYHEKVADLVGRGFDVETIMVWRHQLDIINSAYTQRVKTFQLFRDFDAYWPSAIVEDRYFYDRSYRKFITTSGKTSLLEFDQKNLLGNFLRRVGLSDPESLQAVTNSSANVSPLAHEVEALRMCGELFRAWRINFAEALQYLTGLRPGYDWTGRFYGPSEDQYREAAALFDEVNARFIEAAHADFQPSPPKQKLRHVFDAAKLDRSEGQAFSRYLKELTAWGTSKAR
ncbi:MAG: hypothetical protein WA989_16275 [Henriciella sp.]|uniref:hypothetical protein n=1 Tax=Henriciella sp. TaxID=1968823 RepID=UPI003C794E3F